MPIKKITQIKVQTFSAQAIHHTSFLVKKSQTTYPTIAPSKNLDNFIMVSFKHFAMHYAYINTADSSNPR
jgi:hypothetical protein